jgi:hypothetical protein
LVAVFLPHSTHRLQPLDVSLFIPLATYYSQSIDIDTNLSLGLSHLSKHEFFENFYPAFDKGSTKAIIGSGSRKTGIELFDPEQVLKVFKKQEDEDSEGSQASSPSTSHTSSCLDSPSAVQKIRRIVNQEVAHRDVKSQRTIQLLGDAYLGASARLKLTELREQGLIEALKNEKKKGSVEDLS